MADKKNPTGDKNEQGVAPPVTKAANHGPQGTYRDMKDKPDPDTIAQEQVLPEDSETGR
jgi:hypothetical protein